MEAFSRLICGCICTGELVRIGLVIVYSLQSVKDIILVLNCLGDEKKTPLLFLVCRHFLFYVGWIYTFFTFKIKTET